MNKETGIEKALIAVLIVSIFIASGVIIHEKVTLPVDKFTAFYILSETGKIGNYTTDLYLGRSTSINLGIENHEHATVDYTLQLKLGRATLNSQEITLKHGENWQGTVFFIPNRIGPKTKLEFLLDKNGTTDKSLHLWVVSHVDPENLEILNDYTIAQPPEIRNSDMELESDWVYTSNTKHFRGSFFNSSSPVSPENAMICGYITDTITGLPVAKASISVSNYYGYRNQGLTNENGYYELKTITDHLLLEAWKYGYETKTIWFDAVEGQAWVYNMTLETLPLFNVTVERVPAGDLQTERLKVEKLPPEKLSPLVPTLKGYVTDNMTDFPIENAHVIATNYRGFKEHATTDERGYFELKVASERPYIEARASGYALKGTSVKIADEDTVNLKLTPENSTMKGYILDAVGEPIAGANIRVGDHAKRYKQTCYNDTESNETGYYEISTTAGHIWLVASHDRYFSNGTDFDIAYGETEKIDMWLNQMPAGNATVCGYVFYNDTGSGLCGVEVAVSDHDCYRRSTVTDSNGYYEIDTVPGHLWLDVYPQIYTDSIELYIADGQTLSEDIKLDASPISSYKISYPFSTRSEYGYYGAIYQDIESEEGIAVLSFKVIDSYTSNNSGGYLFKQVLLNDVVIWADDVAGDEGWQQVKIPITLESGKNRIMLRVYDKQVGGFRVNVLWDDVEIEPFPEFFMDEGTEFNIYDPGGGGIYPEMLFGEASEYLAIVKNNEMLRNDYTIHVKLGEYPLGTWEKSLDSGEEWHQKISLVPNQVGNLKLEFILLKNEMPCRSVPFWITSTVGENVTAPQIYTGKISIPKLANGDMESINGWSVVRNNENFSGEIVDTTSTSPINSYEISYPRKTPSNQGDYCGISQNFTVTDRPAVVLLSFNVKDSYLGDDSGNHVKQVLLNRDIIWTDDVAGDGGWQHVEIPVTLHDPEIELTLRVYEENNVSDFPISVWWDDVEIKPISEIDKKPPVEFFISDTNGREYSPTELHLGVSSEFSVVTRNNKVFENEYVFQLAVDGDVIKTREFRLKAGAEKRYNLSFRPDRAEDLHLEFSLFNLSTHEVLAYTSMTASCTIDYDDLEPLLRYGIYPLPTIRDGDMEDMSAWDYEYEGSFKGSHTTEDAVTPYSYRIAHGGYSNAGDFGELSQNIRATTSGVVVLSFYVKDSFDPTSEDADNIIKQVLLNDKVIWENDASGRDTGYVGWREYEYNLLEQEWVKKEVPSVKSGWMRVDVPVYLRDGVDNKLRLRVYAKEAVGDFHVDVYWDDVEIKRINELVKVGDLVQVQRYGW